MDSTELNKIKANCLSVITTFSEESLSYFIAQLDEIPNFFANSTESLIHKLSALKNAEIFNAVNCLFHNPIDSTAQLKVLKFWDFLVSTCSSQTELDILFTDNTTNNLILYPFEFSSKEILQSYVTVLKGISLKAKQIDPKKFLTDDENDCPLYSHALQYISNIDSVVISAARLVVLNICLIKYPPLQAFLTDKSSRSPIDHLIDNLGPDEFAFLSDFLNVAPLKLCELVIRKLRSTLLNCPENQLSRAATFLADSPARSMLIDIVSIRLRTFPITAALTLGLLHFCLERRLILIDSAIKWGLIDLATLPTFSKTPKQLPEAGSFREELNSVLSMRMSLPIDTFVSILRCLELLYKSSIPSFVINTNNEIIDEIKQLNSNTLMEMFLGPPEPRRRCDIEFLIENFGVSEEIEDEKKLLIQLAEIQASICRWRKKRFSWFTFDKSEANDNSHSFSIPDNKNITLSSSELKIADDQVYPTNSLYMIKKKDDNKIRKYVDIVIVKSSKSAGNTFMLSSTNTEQIHIEFSSTSVSQSFQTELMNIQKEILENMLKNLEH